MIHRKRILVSTAVLFVSGIIASAFFLFELSKSRTFQAFGEFYPRVETSEKVVALTFDDGPTEQTQKVLSILKDKNVKGTFYLIGKEIERQRQIGQEIVAAGHEVGNHSYSHPRFYFKSQSFINHEISTTNELIREIGYQGDITFRPPNGKRLFGLPWYLKQHDIKTILWDVEPDTFLNKELTSTEQEEFIVTNILNTTKPGSIILLHPNCEVKCEVNRKALPRVIDELQLLGYRFVTVSELLQYQR